MKAKIKMKKSAEKKAPMSKKAMRPKNGDALSATVDKYMKKGC